MHNPDARPDAASPGGDDSSATGFAALGIDPRIATALAEADLENSLKRRQEQALERIAQGEAQALAQAASSTAQPSAVKAWTARRFEWPWPRSGSWMPGVAWPLVVRNRIACLLVMRAGHGARCAWQPQCAMAACAGSKQKKRRSADRLFRFGRERPANMYAYALQPLRRSRWMAASCAIAVASSACALA